MLRQEMALLGRDTEEEPEQQAEHPPLEAGVQLWRQVELQQTPQPLRAQVSAQ